MKWILFVTCFWCYKPDLHISALNATVPAPLQGIALEKKFRNIQKTLDMLRGKNSDTLRTVSVNPRNGHSNSTKATKSDQPLFGHANDAYWNDPWQDIPGSGDGDFERLNRSYVAPIYPFPQTDDEDLIYPYNLPEISGSGSGPDIWDPAEVGRNISNASLPVDIASNHQGVEWVNQPDRTTPLIAANGTNIEIQELSVVSTATSPATTTSTSASSATGIPTLSFPPLALFGLYPFFGIYLAMCCSA